MIGKQLRELRRKNNMTQAQLANKVGVSTGAIGLWETNKREPDNQTLLKFAEIFNVSTDYLLGDISKCCMIIGKNGDYIKFKLNDDALLSIKEYIKNYVNLTQE